MKEKNGRHWQIFILMSLLLMASFTVSLRAEELQRKEVFLYEVQRCSAPPKIDGILNDACWKNLPAATNFRTGLYSGGRPDVKHNLATRQTFFKVCYDKNNLYIGIKLQDPHPERVIATVTTYDGPIWNDDSVEIYVEPGYTRKRYYVFSTNAINTRRDARWEYRYEDFIVDDKWGSKTRWYSRASRGKDAWYIEAVIPFADMDGASSPQPGDLWSFQIVRFCRDLIKGAAGSLYNKKTFEYSSWAPGGNYKEPDKFGFLYFSTNFSQIERLITEKLSPAMGTTLLRFRGRKGEFLYTDYEQARAECIEGVQNSITKLKDIFNQKSRHWNKGLLDKFKARIARLESDADRFIKSPNPVTFSSDAQGIIHRAETVSMEIREAALYRELQKGAAEGR